MHHTKTTVACGNIEAISCIPGVVTTAEESPLAPVLFKKLRSKDFNSGAALACSALLIIPAFSTGLATFDALGCTLSKVLAVLDVDDASGDVASCCAIMRKCEAILIIMQNWCV